MVKSGTFRSPIGIDVLGNVWYHDIGSDMPGGLVLPFVESGYVTAEAGDTWLGCKRYYPDIADQVGNIQVHGDRQACAAGPEQHASHRPTSDGAEQADGRLPD